MSSEQTNPNNTLSSISEDALSTLLCAKFAVAQLHGFQLAQSINFTAGRDVFLVSAPGSGKTLVMSAPFLADQALGKPGIGLVIVPSKILTEQQEQIFSRLGLRSLAINEDTVRLARLQKRDLFKELASGSDVRVAVMTPWMLSSLRMRQLLNDKDIKPLFRWFFADEVHLFNEEGSVWRVVYQAIKHMRARLPSSTIWGAFTGTASISEARTIAAGLGFRSGDYVDARYTLDRPNLKYIARFCSHPTSGFEFYDLAWLIPFDLKDAADIPTTLVFCQTIDLGWRVMSFLDELLPAALPNRFNLIKLCNAIFPSSYRQRFKSDMEAGRVRIGICTETCTYGLDIRNVQRVVTFGEVASYAKMKQELCRAGRDGSTALVYTYAPAWVRDIPFYEIKGKQAKEDLARRSKLPTVVFDWFNASAPHLLTTRCPRQVDAQYNSEHITIPSSACCNHHHPAPETEVDKAMISRHIEHRKATSSIAPKETLPRSDGTFPPLETHFKTSLTAMLKRWRRNRWWKTSCAKTCDLPSNTFLPTHILLRLVDKAHICTTYSTFELVLRGWEHLDSHGEKLFQFITQVLRTFSTILDERQYDVPAPLEPSKPSEPSVPSQSNNPATTHPSSTALAEHSTTSNTAILIRPVRLLVHADQGIVAAPPIASEISLKRQTPMQNPSSPPRETSNVVCKRARS